jgi:hypothetical protein
MSSLYVHSRDLTSCFFLMFLQEFNLDDEFGEVVPGGTDQGIIELTGRMNAYQTYEFTLKVRAAH